MYTIVIETPTLLNRTFFGSSGKVSNRISAELYHFCKRLGISRSCSDISSGKKGKTTTCNRVYSSGSYSNLVYYKVSKKILEVYNKLVANKTLTI